MWLLIISNFLWIQFHLILSCKPDVTLSNVVVVRGWNNSQAERPLVPWNYHVERGSSADGPPLTGEVLDNRKEASQTKIEEGCEGDASRSIGWRIESLKTAKAESNEGNEGTIIANRGQFWATHSSTKVKEEVHE